MDPLEGVNPDAVEFAHRGWEIVRMAAEVSALKAQEKWRSMLRTKCKHGGVEEDLFDEYYQAVERYKARMKYM